MELPQGEFVDSVEKGDEVDEPGDFGHCDQMVKDTLLSRPADQQRRYEKHPHHKPKQDCSDNYPVAALKVHPQERYPQQRKHADQKIKRHSGGHDPHRHS